MRKLFFIPFLLLLSSCASTEVLTDRDGHPYKWLRTRSAVPQSQWKYVIMPIVELRKACGSPRFVACAIVLNPAQQCTIYLPEKYTSYHKWHEEQHCKGWTH